MKTHNDLTPNDRRVMLNDYIIMHEYLRCINYYGLPSSKTIPTMKDFPIEDLFLSLDDFSKKQGWMK